MSTPSGERAGHQRDGVTQDVDQEVGATEPVEREGEYTDSDVGPDDTDPPKGSYVSKDV